MNTKKRILLTNDDGHFSAGIQRLRQTLSGTYDITIVAPDRERSATSMALTLHHPLRIEGIEPGVFAVDGTPADCINLAIQKLLPRPPDFVISGMNLGENLSEDVLFSGTVGGAFAASLYGIPSMAISLIPDRNQPSDKMYDIEEGARVSERILSSILPRARTDVVYNVNIPNPSSGRIVLTTLGSKRYFPTVVENDDPRGRKYYWIGTGTPSYDGKIGTDIWAIQNGHVSLGLVRYDLSGLDGLDDLAGVFDEV